MLRPAPCLALAGILSLTMGTIPAHADQFLQAADGGAISCSVSARELTRFSLVGDQFASVSKISTGYPYNDFAVSNEPLRGDIYISVPETYAARRVSFFATTKKGLVYKFACAVDAIEASQIFITNPALGLREAQGWEAETPLSETAVRLIQAMANDATLPGYQLRQAAAAPTRVGALELQLVAEYRGAALAGKVVRLTNRRGVPLTIDASDLAPRDTLAVGLAEQTLAPHASTTAFLVTANPGDQP
ncbi:MAG: type-F conjugative transfer system secretin TraK [Novosphingobium sp.]